MALKRYGKKTAGKKRVYKTKKNMSLMRLPKLYNFTRWATTTVGTGDRITLTVGSTYVGVAMQFQMNYLPGNAEFQALFDMLF